LDDAAHAARQRPDQCAARQPAGTQVLDFVEIVTANRVHRKAHACQNAVSFGFHNP
jgi:hypothetical protein